VKADRKWREREREKERERKGGAYNWRSFESMRHTYIHMNEE
jgi:hypothetical protein